MRLAREITDMLADMSEEPSKFPVEFVAAEIAAKLEPLRDVLYVGLGAAMLVTPRSEPVIDKIKAGIESLSEEE